LLVDGARRILSELTRIGTSLGNYRLDSELGTGGMGTVYRATHEVLGKTAAVKLLHGDDMNPMLVHRFINEAKAASAIQHPGIVEVFDFGTSEDGRAFLVMEFLAGESLARRIESRGRLPASEASRIARDIAGALAAAHRRGIIHRDLKPDNVFLVPDGERGERPKLLDFGIAKLVGSDASHTETGALIGTPLYMAPEQARAARDIDARADLYSLGCILHEMLVGAPPFVAEGAGELIALHMFGKALRPSLRVPGVSPALDAIVLRLLEKEPAARFACAEDVIAALDGQPAMRPPIPTVDDSPPPSSTLPWIAAAIVLVVAGVLAAVFFATRSTRVTVEPPAAPTVVAPRPPAPAPPPTTEPAPAPPPAPVKQPTPRHNRPTTNKGSPIENSLD